MKNPSAIDITLLNSPLIKYINWSSLWHNNQNIQIMSYFDNIIKYKTFSKSNI